MSKNGKLSLTQKAKVARNRYAALAFGKALQIDKFEPQMETKIADMCNEAWAAGYFYAKKEIIDTQIPSGDLQMVKIDCPQCKLVPLPPDSLHEYMKDFMKEESVSEDFEIALEKKVREAQDWTYIEEFGGECPLSEEFGAYDLEKFARWGANWKKEQMLAKSIDVTVHIDAGGYPYIPQMELWDYDKDKPLAEEGDIVKVLVIKQ